MINLLHLSDLHFGYDQDDTARAQRALALDALVKELSRLEAEWRPQILVISGDLTWQGKPAGYTELGEWLTKKLFPATGLTAAGCVVCPGNHDLDRNAAIALLDWTGDPKKADQVLRPEWLAGGFARPFEAFVKFAELFGIPAPRLHDAPNYLAGVRELHGIHFVCANSAWFCRDDKDRGELWLGLPQLQSMLPMDPDDYDKAPITVAVLHHPQEWLANPEYNAYGDRRNTYGYLAERSHAILSGHTHGAIERATRCYDRARLFLGGATYDNHAYRNNFSLLQIDPDERIITRRPWEFDPRKGQWEEKESDTYSLRTEKLGRGTPDPAKYLAWLRDQTQFIDLHQLKVGPGQVPPRAIDLLYIKLMTTAPAATGGMERPEPVSLEEALENRALVIEGKPGAGKTTFLRWLAWMLCRPAGPPPGLPVQDRCPLFVRISELDQHISRTLERGKAGDPTTAADPRWIAHFLASRGWGLNKKFFLDKLRQKDGVLLLDGLDEAANEQRRVDIVRTIQDAAAQYACHIVVTTRPGAHQGRATLVGFTPARIEDLDADGINGFLLQWCRWLKRGNEAAAQAYYAELRPAVAAPSIRILARNPLMLTALAVLHVWRHRLPEQRVHLYEQIMDWLAEQAAYKRREYSKYERLERFGRLALAMQEWKGGQKTQIGVDAAAKLITPPMKSIEVARQFLEQAQIDSGIVTLRGGEIAFWHKSFQEYLAARKLADKTETEIGKRARRFLYAPEGREVLPLLAGCLSNDRLDPVMADLIGDALGQKALKRQAHGAGVLGNMLRDVAFRYELSEPAKGRFGKLSDAVMDIFEKGKTRGIGLRIRVDAAEALDQASQSRLRTPDQEDYWRTIRGGTFTIGGLKAYQSLPWKSVAVATFRIGRFPVTVWEYGKFLDDTNLDKPERWDEQDKHPSRPVVGVTWHDAQRYCEWAGCQLPTEEQWEFAARGTPERIYPWGPEGQDPDEHRANFGRSVGEPTPGGMFPDGETPEGVADMAGNVWEWTRSDYDENSKVLRGASFYVEARDLGAAVRYWYEPGDWVDVGFRCVRE